MAIPPQDDDRFYKGDTLKRAFAISSVIMLVFTIWLVLDDSGREWKGYQKDFFSLRKAKYEKQIEEAKSQVDPAKLQSLQDQIAKAEEAHQANKDEEKKLQKDLVRLTTARVNKVDKYQAAKGVYDVRKYEYENVWGHKVAHEALPKEQKGDHSEGTEAHPEMGAKEKAELDKLKANWEKVSELYDDANSAVAAEEAMKAEIEKRRSDIAALQKELKVARAEWDRLEAAKSASELTLLGLVRSAPILDMANPVFRIQQTVLPGIRDDVFFAQVQKVDRCTTCHLGIDNPMFADAPQPFKTHPNLDLMLGSRSPHPIDKIGCTVCHEGRGQSVDFVRAAHTPRNEEQKKEWQKKYGWHEMHHVIEKMLPLQYTEGKCHVCHKQTEHVPAAQKLNKSIQLVRGAGCYGCHRIEGWDHIRKPAPSLKKVKGKLNRDWIVKWVRNPYSFNDHARMPAQFHQGNTESPEYTAFQEAEIFAITDYILSESDDYKPSYSVGLGNAERGKEIFKSVGCLGCHGMDDFPEGRQRYGRAPDLSTVGSKISKEWLTQWLKNPQHYWVDTTMPSLRLSDGEISDVSAYLLSKKNAQFEQLEVGNADFEAQKKVLELYYMRDPKMAPATREKVHAVVEAMSPQDVVKTLGRNGVLRYGCYGCHELKGLEKTPGTGTELSEHGSKLVNKFDFGYLPIERSVASWIKQKLTSTRSFDKGMVKEYLDLLRMPNFQFSDGHKDSVVTFILGHTAQKIQAPWAKELNAREAQMEEGARVVHKYNCQGCHMVEGMFKSLPDGHPDFDAHEQAKWDLEGRVMKYYAEDESYGPPPLVTEGSRVRTDWAYRFLEDPSHKLRRGLKIRMPSFHLPPEENNKIVTYWARYGQTEFPISDLQAPQISGARLEGAKKLFASLQCGSCHTVGQATLSQDDLEGGSKGFAPDLSRSYGRLHKDWIKQLLKDPQKMVPGTRMPGFWTDANPAPDVLGGDTEAQIDALAEYVLWLGYQRGGGRPVGKTVSELEKLFETVENKTSAGSKPTAKVTFHGPKDS